MQKTNITPLHNFVSTDFEALNVLTNSCFLYIFLFTVYLIVLRRNLVTASKQELIRLETV
jgi:hypothetical protein